MLYSHDMKPQSPTAVALLLLLFVTASARGDRPPPSRRRPRAATATGGLVRRGRRTTLSRLHAEGARDLGDLLGRAPAIKSPAAIVINATTGKGAVRVGRLRASGPWPRPPRS